MSSPPRPFDKDVLVVGAGAAGVGVAVALRAAGVRRLALVDRHEIGASFVRWPAETRFISPSFTGHAFGALDLNAVAPHTSPAFTLWREHPTGREYAVYLRAVAEHFALPVTTGVDVTRVTPLPEGGFAVRAGQRRLRVRFLVWAAGEFAYPATAPFPGAEFGLHTARIASYADLPGDEYVIVGAGESGVDAAVHLAALGRRVRLLDPRPTWTLRAADPSLVLAPFTVERLAQALRTGLIEPCDGVRVTALVRDGDEIVVRAGRRRFSTRQPPLLAVGFVGGLRQIAELLDWSDDGHVLLSEASDESTRVPGLFIVGPGVRHRGVSFCFIYKFRQRFAIVAAAIASRLGLDPSAMMAQWRAQHMWLDDLACCTDDCVC